jgi:hypothetical protein
MNLFRIAVVLIPLAASVFSVGEAQECSSAKVPTMTLEKVCLVSSRTPTLNYLCRYDTLKNAPHSGKVTAYAFYAAAVVKRSYEATIAEGQSLLRAGMNDAVQRCVQGTTEAHMRMEAVIHDLIACDYRKIWQEYNDAAALVLASGDMLADARLPLAGSRLVGMNAYDRQITDSARAVGALAIFLTGHA